MNYDEAINGEIVVQIGHGKLQIDHNRLGS